MPAQQRALIADDQPDVLAALQLLLKCEGYEIESATSPAGVLDAVATREFDVVLIDLNYARDTTSGREGLELIDRIHAADTTLPIVVMTAWGTIELAVEAMRRGVRDFVLKPWENARLVETLRAQVEQGHMLRARRTVEAFETETAREVQQALLPKQLPSIPGVEIAGSWRPAGSLSGDCFDVIPFDDGRFAVCIADASGKGTGAALLASNVQAIVRAVAGPDVAPSEVCARVNAILCQNTDACRFVTLVYAIVDVHTGRLTYANAGHNPPLLARADGAVERLVEGGALAGVFEASVYEEAELELRAGDRLVLFTDGLVETRDRAGEELGEPRVLELVRLHRRERAEPLLHRLVGEATAFCEGRFDDDATLVAISIG